MRPSLRAEGIGFAYGEIRLFDRLDLDLGPGLATVVGGDGRGKSTLLAILAGARSPGRGDCVACGVRLSEDPAGYRAHVLRAGDHEDTLDATPVSAWFAARALGSPGTDASSRFDPALQDALIDGLELAPHLHKTGAMLSTGTRRKVVITAALAACAPVTLIDDPFAALDRVSSNFLAEALLRLGALRDRVLVVAGHAPVGGVAVAPTLDLGD